MSNKSINVMSSTVWTENSNVYLCTTGVYYSYFPKDADKQKQNVFMKILFRKHLQKFIVVISEISDSLNSLEAELTR